MSQLFPELRLCVVDKEENKKYYDVGDLIQAYSVSKIIKQEANKDVNLEIKKDNDWIEWIYEGKHINEFSLQDIVNIRFMNVNIQEIYANTISLVKSDIVGSFEQLELFIQNLQRMSNNYNLFIQSRYCGVQHESLGSCIVDKEGKIVCVLDCIGGMYAIDNYRLKDFCVNNNCERKCLSELCYKLMEVGENGINNKDME